MDMTDKQLATTLSQHWWVLLIRGLLAILFGLMTWFMPGISLVTLVLLFGAYVLADGILGIWTAITGRKEHDHWWALLIWGVIGAGVGILTFTVPGVTALALLFYIAIWAISTGVLQIVTAVRLRNEITGEWLLILGGIISVIFGVILMTQPAAGALALLWIIGAYAILFGVLLVVLAFKARSFGK